MRWVSGVALVSAICCAASSIAGQSSLYRIAGRVTNGQAGVAVIVHRPGEGTFKKVLSDASGSYVVDDLPSGTYTVEFAHEIFDVFRQHGVQVRVGEPVLEITTRLNLIPLCECVEWPRILDPGKVTGTVVDEDGRPIVGARLEIRGARSEQKVAGPDGDFELTLPAGTTWRLTASDTFFSSETREIRVSRNNRPVKIQLTRRWGVELSGTETLRRGCTCYRDLFTHRNR